MCPARARPGRGAALRLVKGLGWGAYVVGLFQAGAGCGGRSSLENPDLGGSAVDDGGSRAGRPGLSGAGSGATAAGKTSRAGNGGVAGAGGTRLPGGGGQSGSSSRAGSSFAGEPPVTTGGAGGLGQAGEPSLCPSAEPWSTNLEKCAPGFVHREAALACPLPPRDETAAAGGAGSPVTCPIPLKRCAASEECASDLDCDAGGYCVKLLRFSFDVLDFATTCLYPCQTDSDCFATELCACSPFVQPAGSQIQLGVCRGATQCKVDANCGPGALCSSVLNTAPFGIQLPPSPDGFVCTTPADACRANEDCPPVSSDHCCPERRCGYDGGAPRHCYEQPHCGACD